MTKQIFPTEKLTHEFSKNGFQAKTFPNYDIQKSIFLNKINQEIDLTKLPQDLKISTMTITCNIDTLIDVQNVGKYVDLNFGDIVCVKYGPNNMTRTLIKLKKNNKKTQKTQKNFYNQATIIAEVKNKRKINVKLFKNGAIQMTGCKTTDEFINALEILCANLNKKKAVYDKKEKKIIKREFVSNPENIKIENITNFKIRMINSNFHIGFMIDRNNLYQLLTKKGITCTYEPCINIKYNYKNKDIISVFVFESGSIIITGAKTVSHIDEAYKFITKILVENYDTIVKNDIDKFLERDDIKQLINDA
jgi:TATA-box binding protein (TBP) (component of TFIID and TFIIIB)